VFVAVVLLALVGAGISGTVQGWEPSSQPGIAGSVRPGSGWHMRAGPTRNAESAGTVASGTAVRVRCMHGNWAELIEPHDGVYVYRDGLELASIPPSCG
jgi:hypothetical protein